MPLTLRPGRPEDATVCGTICYEAFKTIAEQHSFPTNYASPEVAIERMVTRLAHPGVYAVVAELDGRVVGSNFLDERDAIAGLGPITVAPTVQNRTIGRHLGYATAIGVSGHAVGETTGAVQALIGGAPAFERGGFLVPLCHGELFRWCLSAGFRVAAPQTLMSLGFYQEPAGAFLPSILY
jgi:predicted N-acetyltransferase YhbS